jgi:hypothetical protein
VFIQCPNLFILYIKNVGEKGKKPGKKKEKKILMGGKIKTDMSDGYYKRLGSSGWVGG